MFGWFAPKDTWPKVGRAELKKRARILVVDDQEFPYKVLFEKDEYNIDKWDDINDFEKIEDGYYDLILLDLQGVGREQTAEEGLGILKHIKQKNPTQIVIAFSNADWPLKFQDFFNLADCTMPKSADYVDFKRRVDELIEKKFSLNYYLEILSKEINNSHENLPDMMAVAQASIFKNNPEKFARYLRKKAIHTDKIDRALTIINIAIGAYQLCKNLI